MRRRARMLLLLPVVAAAATATSDAAQWPLFLGTNVPWHWFGYDIGGGAWTPEWFGARFKAVSGRQNVQRVFLHADGRASPHFDERGFVVGLAQPQHGGVSAFGRELQALVALAAEHRLVLQLCLWSFDACNDNGFPIRSDLISDVEKTRSYIENALLPLLSLLAEAGCEHSGCILEIFNEPEW